MRLLSLNVRHGGARHGDAWADALARSRADLLALAEIREASEHALDRLSRRGFVHRADPATGLGGLNAVVAMSAVPFAEHATPSYAPPEAQHLWRELELGGLIVLAVHVPARSRPEKAAFWDAILNRVRELSHVPAVLIGDLNTGDQDLDRQGAPFWCADQFSALSEEHHWIDAFRAVNGELAEYSWFSTTGNGFRIDHAFLSPSAAAELGDCFYDHRPRLQGWSDHSALVVELERRVQG